MVRALSRCPFRPGCIIATRGDDFREAGILQSDRLKVAVGASVLTRTGLRLFGICDCLSFPKNPSRLNRRVGPDDDRGIAILELLDRSLRGSPARRSALDPTTPN